MRNFVSHIALSLVLVSGAAVAQDSAANNPHGAKADTKAPKSDGSRQSTTGATTTQADEECAPSASEVGQATAGVANSGANQRKPGAKAADCKPGLDYQESSKNTGTNSYGGKADKEPAEAND